MLQELIKRAEKVNSVKSSKNDYRKYFEIRNKLIFMDNIYKFENEIVGETQFKKAHPLLFRRVTEVIDNDNNIILENKLSNDIQKKYENILNERLYDDKNFSDVEKLWEEVKPKLETSQVSQELLTKRWGQKDFRVIDPFGFYIRFTELVDWGQ